MSQTQGLRHWLRQILSRQTRGPQAPVFQTHRQPAPGPQIHRKPVPPVLPVLPQNQSQQVPPQKHQRVTWLPQGPQIHRRQSHQLLRWHQSHRPL